MLQKLTFDQPIMSAEIGDLLFEDGKWKYVYHVDVPEELTDTPGEYMVYGHISSLVVKADDHSEISNNIHFKTLEEYLQILQTQIDADMQFRIQYFAKKSKHTINTVVLENRNYLSDELSKEISYLAFEMIQGEDHTVFAAVY